MKCSSNVAKCALGVVGALVLFVAVGMFASCARAAVGDKGFYYGARSPEHLAQIVEAALKKNKNGTDLLDAAKCRADGSCATPLDYLEGINARFAEAGLKKRLNDVSEVPTYLRSLQRVHSPHGTYEVACLRPIGGGKFHRVMDCLHRAFDPDEEAWVDIVTEGNQKLEVTMITSKCANAVYKKVPLRIEIIGGMTCPEWKLTANAWSLSAMPAGLREKVEVQIAAAKARDARGAVMHDEYRTDAVSRTSGPSLRKEVKKQASVTADIEIRFLSWDQRAKEAVLDGQGKPVFTPVGTLKMVGGVGTFTFPRDPRQFIVEMVWPAQFESPTVSGAGGERILRIFPHEWASCNPHAHGVKP